MKRSVVKLLLVCQLSILFFLFVNSSQLIEVYQVSEGREGVVVKSIMENGSWILPLRHQAIIPSKPPLYHWMAAILTPSPGQFDSFHLRLPSMIAGLGTCLLLAILMLSHIERPKWNPASLIAVFVLATTIGHWSLSMDGRVDMVFNFLVVAVIVGWLVALHKSESAGTGLKGISHKTYFLLSIVMGLAMLSKGPLGLVFPAMVIGCVTLLDYGPRALLKLLSPAWFCSLAVAAPWYVAAAVVGSNDFIGRQIIFENWQRLVGGEGIPAKPPYFYLVHFCSQISPWSFIIPLSLILMTSQFGIKDCLSIIKPTFIRDSNLRKLSRRCLIWIIVVIIALSLSSGKRRAYLLPVLPAFSTLFALAMVSISNRLRSYQRLKTISRDQALWGGYFPKVRFLASLALLLPLCLVVSLGFSWLQPGVSERVSSVILSVVPVMQDGWLYFLISGTTFLSLVFLLGEKQWHTKPQWVLSVAPTICLMLYSVFILGTFMEATKSRAYSFRHFTEQVEEIVPQVETITFIKKKRDETFDGLFFYLNNRTVLLEPDQLPNKTGFYIAPFKWYEAQSSAWRENTMVRLSGGRSKDLSTNPLCLFYLNPS